MQALEVQRVENVASLAAPVCLRAAERELVWREGQRAGRWTCRAVLLTAAEAPAPVRAISAERVDERRDATWSCCSSPTLSSGPGSRTNMFGLLEPEDVDERVVDVYIHVAHCKAVAGLLLGVARLAPPRDARAPSRGAVIGFGRFA